MGSRELIVSGAVRVCFSCICSLFLGFGLAIGTTAYWKMTNHMLAGSDDLTRGLRHDSDGPRWQGTPSRRSESSSIRCLGWDMKTDSY